MICRPFKLSYYGAGKEGIEIYIDKIKEEPDEYLEKILGGERAGRLNPLRTFLKSGISVSFDSDAPCTTPNPIEWINKAVNNPNKGEAVPIRDALRMCTYNGCFASFDENEIGSLGTGKTAGMVILSENPYAAESRALGKIKVKRLILAGYEYRSAKENVASAIFRGLSSRAKC